MPFDEIVNLFETGLGKINKCWSIDELYNSPTKQASSTSSLLSQPDELLWILIYPFGFAR